MLQFLLSVGLGLILAPVTALFTDMPRIVRIALRMVLRDADHLRHAAAPALQNVLTLNPMAGILEMYRAGFFPQDVFHSIISVVIITRNPRRRNLFKRLEPPVLKEI